MDLLIYILVFCTGCFVIVPTVTAARSTLDLHKSRPGFLYSLFSYCSNSFCRSAAIIMSTSDLNPSCPGIPVLFVLLLRCIKWLYSKPTFDTRTRNIAAIAVALSGRNSLITQLHFCIFCTLQDCNIFSGCKEWLSLISC